MAAELRQDVNGDDVAAFVAAGADAEAGDLFFWMARVGGFRVGGFDCGFRFRDQAVRAAETQVGAQLALRVGDFGFVAGVVNFVERVEIFGLETSESDVHSGDWKIS